MSELGRMCGELKSVEELGRYLDRVPRLFIPRYYSPIPPAKQSTSVCEILGSEGTIRRIGITHIHRRQSSADQFGSESKPFCPGGPGERRQTLRKGIFHAKTADRRAARCNDAQLSEETE